jgi:hypothetical protein
MFSRLPEYEQTTSPWSRLIRTVFLMDLTVTHLLGTLQQLFADDRLVFAF